MSLRMQEMGGWDFYTLYGTCQRNFRKAENEDKKTEEIVRKGLYFPFMSLWL